MKNPLLEEKKGIVLKWANLLENLDSDTEVVLKTMHPGLHLGIEVPEMEGSVKVDGREQGPVVQNEVGVCALCPSSVPCAEL